MGFERLKNRNRIDKDRQTYMQQNVPEREKKNQSWEIFRPAMFMTDLFFGNQIRFSANTRENQFSRTFGKY